nr:PREDICTED: putative cysteine proteinase CG12163 isoform X1 [Bemisia tabaci]
MNKIGYLIISFLWLAPITLSYYLPGDELSVELRLFNNFMIKFGKSYENAAEQAKRFDIFRTNLKVIAELNNDRYDNATYGISRFADLTGDEFKKKMLRSNSSLPESPLREGGSKIRASRIKRAGGSSSHTGGSFSWTDNRYYPPAQDQDTCDSCGHIGGVSAVSIMYSAQKKRRTNLSIQQLIDCDPRCCNAVTYTSLFEAIRDTYLASETDYPYRASFRAGECDRAAVAKGVATIKSWRLISGEANILANLKNGPLPAKINADRIQHYRGGVITNCPNTGSNHGVTIVGYGVEDGVNYYLVRNTYGPGWGPLEGHLKVQRGTCDIEERVYSIEIKTKRSGGCFMCK